MSTTKLMLIRGANGCGFSSGRAQCNGACSDHPDDILGTHTLAMQQCPTRRYLWSGVGRRRWRAVDFEEQLVAVAPPPVLARLVRPDQRVIGMLMPVGGGMAIRGVVATSDVPAVHAQPQMHPAATDAEAVLAAVGTRCDLAHRVQVGAGRTVHLGSTGRGSTSVSSMRLPHGSSMNAAQISVVPKSTRERGSPMNVTPRSRSASIVSW